jgi:hypothetical protein
MADHRSISEELAGRFRADVETISKTLADYCALTHTKAVSELDQVLFRWLDFRMRFVDPKPRPLVYSTAFPKQIPDDVQQALSDFERHSLNGDDLNPFQGKGLTMYHDTSGVKRQNRTDHLWAEWNIHHFHLASLASGSGQYYSDRSGWLLFAVIFDNAIACVDITDHGKGAMENRSLIENFIRNWPEAAEPFRFKGILPSQSQPSEEDIKKARVGGYSLPVVVDGAVYAPGGITSASTAERVSLAGIHTAHGTRAAAQLVIGEMEREGSAMGEEDLPHLSLALTPCGLGIFDDRTRKCWPLPRPTGPWANHAAARMHDLILPEWIAAKIAEAFTNATPP